VRHDLRLGERDRAFEQPAGHDVSMIPASSAFGADTALPSVHISSAILAAAQTRQPLRAAGARNDAEQHFRLSDFRVLRRDAEVTRCATSRPPPRALP
jgi:hypothetical protein